MTKKLIKKIKDNKYVYSYYLLETFKEGNFVYGFKINRGIKHRILDSKGIEDVCIDKGKALENIEKFIKNVASPISLGEIVEDMLI